MHFIDLQIQYQKYKKDVDAAIQKVLDSSKYISGPEVHELEQTLADYVGTVHGVGFSSGTESLKATLMAWEIGPGDEVITTPFTFIASGEVIAVIGAKPVFVDVDPNTLNIDPTKIEAAITPNTKAIVPVSLYGQCANLSAINAIAQRHKIPVLEDGCQSFGAVHNEERSCGISSAGATSFFPAKPLGCYGDGGMTFTNDENLANRLRIIREHGQAARYRHAMLGGNGRLDTIQAAVLLAKFPFFEEEIENRQKVANYYLSNLPKEARPPTIRPDNKSVFSQFTIRIKERDKIQRLLSEKKIPTAIHYPVPLHRQPVFAYLAHKADDFPVAQKAASEVLSLPMHPFMTISQQDQVLDALRKSLQEIGGE
ncbi:MAG: DegT/DnrJ/EryC1/StrS family aminotransferase [Magnetococcales bacterium]|nr:DegT/DnrJ/EryC1/StrS family aminotransferase [Magnetococcales bacterium]